MSLNGSENLDPRFNHHYGSADENDPNNHPHHVPSFKEYTKSISKPPSTSFYSKPPSTSFYSKPTSNISSRNGSIPSKNRVPVVTSFNKNDTKDAVQKLFINDARRHENGVLKQLNNYHSNTSNIRVPTSSIIPYHNVQIVDEQGTKLIPPTTSDSDYDEAPLLDLYKADELESKIDPGSAAILNSGITYEQITSGYQSATKTLTSQEYDPILQTLDDSRISFLNPHQAYVKVNYPQYTKPLAKNGTPLDLSQVPKNRLAPPFLDYEEPKLSQDETRLLQVLDHDLKLESYDNDNQFEFEDVGDGENSNIGGFVSFLQKLFKTGPFSKEAKYYKKFPWAKIFHNIDQESDLENQLTKYEKTNNGDSVLFERNNTDMFPINGVIPSPLPLEEMTQTTEALRWSKKKARANK